MGATCEGSSSTGRDLLRESISAVSEIETKPLVSCTKDSPRRRGGIYSTSFESFNAALATAFDRLEDFREPCSLLATAFE